MEDRVIIFASARDSQLTCGFLREIGLWATGVTTWEDCRAELARGAGALVVAAEALEPSVAAELQVYLENQPQWSDLPLLIVAGHEMSGERDRFAYLGNVFVLQRPLAMDTLRSSVSSALRARRRQYEVRALLAQKEEEERRKDEFLAMLAHELRNPLAPLMTGLQLLQLRPAPDVVARTHATMERQIVHLTRLVDDLLDVSRITRRKINLTKRVIDARDGLQRIADTLRGLAGEKAIRVDVAVPAEPVWIDADGVRLEQMLSNLVLNAIKFTPPGGAIRLSAELDGEAAVIRVLDNGIGIPGDQLQRVFELFVQTDRTLDRTHGGLGIGLTVVRVLAELHGGSVELRSPGEGKGTEAILRLPVAASMPAAQGEAVAASPALPQGHRTVLVIEDNADVAEMLAVFLSQLGHRVMVASDGRTGLEAALRNRPDVVVCDIGLPGLNGFEIASRLRADAAFAHCLLIALTGYGDVSDRRRSHEAGFAYHLTKPADPMQVAQLIAGADVKH